MHHSAMWEMVTHKQITFIILKKGKREVKATLVAEAAEYGIFLREV